VGVTKGSQASIAGRQQDKGLGSQALASDAGFAGEAAAATGAVLEGGKGKKLGRGQVKRGRLEQLGPEGAALHEEWMAELAATEEDSVFLRGQGSGSQRLPGHSRCVHDVWCGCV
jgi:hypothetical protein